MEAPEFERWNKLAAELHDAFRSARPYPHVVIDDFLPSDLVDGLADEFSHIGEDAWKHYHHYNERKLAITDPARMPPRTRQVVETLQSQAAIDFFSKLSGIEDLISDPDLEGAGMHMVKRGGFLNVHTDFLAHTKRRNWSRQINLLVYLNQNWREHWNGNLELWDAEMSHCVQSVAPDFNRCVIFNTRPKSYHGHPRPLSCPPGQTRKSILLYYYQDEGEPRELSPTDYRPLPDDPPHKKALVVADRALLRLYSFVKRHTGLTDGMVDRFLKRF